MEHSESKKRKVTSFALNSFSYYLNKANNKLARHVHCVHLNSILHRCWNNYGDLKLQIQAKQL